MEKKKKKRRRKNRLDELVKLLGFEDRKSLLQAKYDEHGSGTKAAEALGFKVRTFNEYARAYGIVRVAKREHTGGRPEGGSVYYDDRPSNVPGPWTNPEASPCGQCLHWNRDKNQPGCVQCRRRLEYLALFESFAPASAFPDAPAHYRGGGVCGIGYQEVY